MRYLLISLVLIFSTSDIKCQQNARQLITIETEMGDIVVELYPDKAPVTVENFLKYVYGGYYKDGLFYRTVTMENQPDNDIKIEVIQGGRNRTVDRPRIPSIMHETTEATGIKHLDGTLSMARSKPGSASSEFFICVNDQPSLDYGGDRNTDLQGFAAFGRVVKGMEVVHAIHRSNCDEQSLNPAIRIINIRPGLAGNRKQ